MPLFDVAQTRRWNIRTKRYFVKVFYHTRGHFDRLLWMRLVFAPTVEGKRQVLQYLTEEAGLGGSNGEENRRSHEQLFERFAESVGVALTSKLTERDYYLPFAQEFNRGLIHWFRTRDWESSLVGFSAYERLDNIDYKPLYELAVSLNLPDKALEFFRVHKEADHFEKSSGQLPHIWQKNESKVREAFSFIYGHQRKMWKGLSDTMMSYRGIGVTS